MRPELVDDVEDGVAEAADEDMEPGVVLCHVKTREAVGESMTARNRTNLVATELASPLHFQVSLPDPVPQ